MLLPPHLHLARERRPLGYALCAQGLSLPTAGKKGTIGSRKDRIAHVFGPFSLGDSLRVYRLQRRGVSLDLQQSLTQSRNPLWEAYLAFFSQQAMGQPTYVLYDPHDGEAFIQVRYRPHQAAADVVFLAPSLSENHRVANAWSQLLDGACIEAAGRGIQRVFANLPDSGAEADTFQQVGFMLYAGEEVYRLAQSQPLKGGGDAAGLRSQRPDDWPAIQRLCVTITPQRVRQAEGGITLATGGGKNRQRYVLPGEDGDDLVGALTVSIGGTAHWLRILVHPEAQGVVEALIQRGMVLLADHPAKAVYCNVRQYEGGVRVGLEAAGFEPYETRALMVKHTVAWVRTPAQELVPALQGRAESLPPAYHINGKAELQARDGRLAAERDA
jgi:hypothetical protein